MDVKRDYLLPKPKINSAIVSMAAAAHKIKKLPPMFFGAILLSYLRQICRRMIKTGFR
jgi:16S rRNA A1518/A1519 N6-dimethyltransferase RsmA/KsgA/DIM1 with predicted DNA glycosylase/AP lyase activity